MLSNTSATNLAFPSPDSAPITSITATNTTSPFYFGVPSQHLHINQHIIYLPINLEVIGSVQWVKSKLAQYPELEWLLDDRVQHTQEGSSQFFPHSWSKRIKNAYYPEFERTILSLVCLYLIGEGSEVAYERFTQLQPDEARLSYQSFQHLHQFANDVIHNDPIELQALEINLILGDMGKTKVAHEKAHSYSIFEPDHDLFLEQCLDKCPEIFPTFHTLPPLLKEKIKIVKGLVHLGHVTQVEGGPEMLNKLKQSTILQHNIQAFKREILTHICDVSAARGHEDNRGSKVLVENTFKAIEAVKEALYYLSTQSEKEVLQRYLTVRAHWLKLNESRPEMYLIARLGAMLRLFNEEQGKILEQAFIHMVPTQENDWSDFDPLIYREEKTPTYIPAVLVNLISAYTKQGLSQEDALKQCIEKGILLIKHILQQYRNNQANLPYDAKLTLNFNQVSGQLRDNPALVEERGFIISPEGIVEITPSP